MKDQNLLSEYTVPFTVSPVLAAGPIPISLIGLEGPVFPVSSVDVGRLALSPRSPYRSLRTALSAVLSVLSVLLVTSLVTSLLTSLLPLVVVL